jgi:aryl-alcohol dehydrogenase-like predicted oxidoreductase
VNSVSVGVAQDILALIVDLASVCHVAKNDVEGKMKKRKLGNTGFEILPLAVGGNVFGWTIDEAASFAILDAFLDAGCNFIDTADVYLRSAPGNVGGESETIIGKWLKRSGKRTRVLIATKVGMPMGPGESGLSRAYIHRAVEQSLRRLQTDCIDLYQSHTDDTATPLEETLSAYADLVQQGKVRAIGASNYSAARLREALETSRNLGLPRYETLQPLYNLYDRAAYEAELQSVCAKHDLGVIPYFALASGFLTGKYRSAADFPKHKRGRLVEKYLDARGLRILGAIDDIAAQRRTSQSAVAVAWVMTRPTITAPIVSATSEAQVRDLLDAMELEFTASEINALDAASSP